MSKEKILVMTARGQTGFATAVSLLELGFPVRAFVGAEDGKASLLKNMGAELFVGSMEDIRDVKKAMVGIKRAYYCIPVAPNGLYKSVLFAAAAEEEGLEHVVVMTQWLSSRTHPSITTKDHWFSDYVFRTSKTVKYIFINPGLFAAMFFLNPDPMTQFGLMLGPFGDGKNAPPSNEDMGRVVAHILKDPEPHVGKIYRPTGPELLSNQQMANIIGKVLGRKVTYKSVPRNMFLKSVKSAGFPAFQYSQLPYYL